MAYRQSNVLVRLAVVCVVAWAAWKYGLPLLEREGIIGGSRSGPSVSSPSADCVGAADEAVAAWSRGIVRFMNPPVDEASWGDFRRDVRSRVDRARSACGCSSESCRMARDVAGEVAAVLSDMDSTVRGKAPPPGDLVQRQERIDLMIEDAWKLADAGR
jgi:hypothetical protein